MSISSGSTVSTTILVPNRLRLRFAAPIDSARDGALETVGRATDAASVVWSVLDCGREDMEAKMI